MRQRSQSEQRSWPQQYIATAYQTSFHFLPMDLMPRYIKYPRTIDATVIQNSRIVFSFLWVDMRSIANFTTWQTILDIRRHPMKNGIPVGNAIVPTIPYTFKKRLLSSRPSSQSFRSSPTARHRPSPLPDSSLEAVFKWLTSSPFQDRILSWEILFGCLEKKE